MTLREFLLNSPPPNQSALITAFIGVSLLGNIHIEHETKDSVASDEMLPQCGSRNPCLPKCCPLDTLVTFSDGNSNLECLETFNNTIRFKSTRYQFLQDSSLPKPLQYSKNRFLEEPKNPSNPNKVNGVQNVSTLKPVCYRLEDDGTLFYLKHFTWIRVPVGNYCMDGFQFSLNQPVQFSRSDGNFGFLTDIHDVDRTRTDNKHDPTFWRPLMLCIASIFLLLTFLVHVLLWQDQNIRGWVAMSSSVTMFLMYCFNASALFLELAKRPDGSRTTVICMLVGMLMHFFSLSNFCWLTTMCFSLFWTFRKITPYNHHDGIVSQYLLYAGFGWGLPLLLVIVSVIVDQIYSDGPCNTFTLPEYGVEFCSISTRAFGPYLIYPVALLLLVNLLFFAFTSWKFYSYQKNTAIARQNLAENHQLYVHTY
ncbi:unnamed protein product [Allacma fusca]|uniref:G-protein coupled receptors family 2 profile 2 domain-containing protein n=1 Tax=Allacma fusca TaxID=39272 RepID=A0A8J2PCT9_9HEXA|nr:unnamed protein product [Allacma fusca]